jgi:RimJ/RimL family protein N-acetyltransferase
VAPIEIAKALRTIMNTEARVNELGQPVGFSLGDWKPPQHLSYEPMEGRWCRLEKLDLSHGEALHAANALDSEGKNWTYLAYGPFSKFADYQSWLEQWCSREDPMFFAIIDKERKQPVGVASYLRIKPSEGSAEVGHINYSPMLQRRTAATESMYLMMSRVFEAGYRRYEWKCDALNAPSCRSAERLGFTAEGVFRQATVYKGRNRDTAWYSILDHEWPALRSAYEAWLDPSNFDGEGRQQRSL